MKIAPIFTAALTTGLVVGSTTVAHAGEVYYAGNAVNGQPVRVEIDSIRRASSRSVDFVYYLGDDRIFAQANCSTRNWTTFPEGQVQYPQSSATQRMVSFVCNTGLAGRPPVGDRRVAFVIDPPSNVRTRPNGDIICALPRRSINTYGSVGSWYRTDACGEMGFIHISQIQFR